MGLGKNMVIQESRINILNDNKLSRFYKFYIFFLFQIFFCNNLLLSSALPLSDEMINEQVSRVLRKAMEEGHSLLDLGAVADGAKTAAEFIVSEKIVVFSDRRTLLDQAILYDCAPEVLEILAAKEIVNEGVNRALREAIGARNLLLVRKAVANGAGDAAEFIASEKSGYLPYRRTPLLEAVVCGCGPEILEVLAKKDPRSLQVLDRGENNLLRRLFYKRPWPKDVCDVAKKLIELGLPTTREDGESPQFASLPGHITRFYGNIFRGRGKYCGTVLNMLMELKGDISEVKQAVVSIPDPAARLVLATYLSYPRDIIGMQAFYRATNPLMFSLPKEILIFIGDLVLGASAKHRVLSLLEDGTPPPLEADDENQSPLEQARDNERDNEEEKCVPVDFGNRVLGLDGVSCVLGRSIVQASVELSRKPLLEIISGRRLSVPNQGLVSRIKERSMSDSLSDRPVKILSDLNSGQRGCHYYLHDC